MTLTKEIVAILSDGKPRGTEDLMALTGKTRQQVFASIRILTAGKYAESIPVQYQLTKAGMERSQQKTITDPAELERRAKNKEKRKAAAQARAQTAKKVMSDTLVGAAMRSRPALAMVWA